MELLTVEDMAMMLKKTATAIHNLKKRGSLPPSAKIGGIIYWKKSVVDNWLKEIFK